MADVINITINEPEPITVQIIDEKPIVLQIIEAEPIKVIVNETTPTQIATIFEPPEDEKRITKLSITKNRKVAIKFEND